MKRKRRRKSNMPEELNSKLELIKLSPFVKDFDTRPFVVLSVRIL